MRDLFFVGFLGALLLLGLRRPFLLVLGYVYIDLVSPQRLSYYLLSSVPISLIFFAAAFLAWIAADPKEGSRFSVRQGIMLALLLWAGWTMKDADFPIEAAQKWDWVWKTLVFAIFLPFTLRTRLRMEALVVFMSLSAGWIIVTGGLKTALSGGGYGTLSLGVDNNAGLYEGSTIATIAIAMIPLILWAVKHQTIFEQKGLVRAFGYALIFACMLIPVGTEARTGLICLAVLIILSLRDTKRRLTYIALIAAAGLIAVPFLPKSFTQRMDTIQGYQGDQSASTRIRVWQWTWDFVREHPSGGGFAAYQQNQFEVTTVDVGPDGTVRSMRVIDRARAWHSSYFELLGELGFPGFGLWVLLNLAGLVRMEMLRHRFARAGPEDRWIRDLAAGLQVAHVIYLVGSLFLALAFQSFFYMWFGLQIALDTYARRRLAADKPTGFVRAKPAAA
ncbi:putative O-glycosylation ligase, exosortase A system-associated [Sphingomonas spermidinifaciens]|uniref:Putative O-glycosylation ligase, exosortase A system-associated n=1 Tax=Sphingomonas spermidinifaciens TaxID=1141889 RepID=A0A2A4B9C9_9SPHN|nr:putative O-glycosylation ligase, exosortase A system-associated [Sphingomonas spermidinifaciens]PCD04389.1 putative O-glycosylation ligase, exosortase A system-associated [Sphingomonas spermidinifaciens]